MNWSHITDGYNKRDNIMVVIAVLVVMLMYSMFAIIAFTKDVDNYYWQLVDKRVVVDIREQDSVLVVDCVTDSIFKPFHFPTLIWSLSDNESTYAKILLTDRLEYLTGAVLLDQHFADYVFFTKKLNKLVVQLVDNRIPFKKVVDKNGVVHYYRQPREVYAKIWVTRELYRYLEFDGLLELNNDVKDKYYKYRIMHLLPQWINYSKLPFNTIQIKVRPWVDG